MQSAQSESTPRRLTLAKRVKCFGWKLTLKISMYNKLYFLLIMGKCLANFWQIFGTFWTFLQKCQFNTTMISAHSWQFFNSRPLHNKYAVAIHETGGMKNRINQNLSKFIEIYQNLPECTKIYQNLSESTETFCNLTKCIEIYWIFL